jgi:DNA-binding HxlR family transcriptional regulator
MLISISYQVFNSYKFINIFQSLGETMHDECTVYRTIDMVSRKWTMVILLELYKGGGGKKRYTDLKNGLCDITPKVLSTRLKELEEDGFITKEVDASSVPIKSEYQLTEMGEEFINVIKDIKCWALKWKVDNQVCSELDCRDCYL